MSEENIEIIISNEILKRLLEINFCGHCLINNNISVPKKVVNIYISYAVVRKFKYSSYFKELLIWICKAN